MTEITIIVDQIDVLRSTPALLRTTSRVLVAAVKKLVFGGRVGAGTAADRDQAINAIAASKTAISKVPDYAEWLSILRNWRSVAKSAAVESAA